MPSSSLLSSMIFSAARNHALEQARGDTDQVDAPGVMLINRAMAERLWPDEDPIGQRMRLYTSPSNFGPWLEIVGVVADAKLRDIGEDSRTEMFQPIDQVGNTWPWIIRDRTLVVQTSVDPMSLAGAIQSSVAVIDADGRIEKVYTKVKAAENARQVLEDL